MAFEYPSVAGVLHLIRVQGHWRLQFDGSWAGIWPSADAAAEAIARHRSGLMTWDRGRAEVPEDLLDWRPLGESL